MALFDEPPAIIRMLHEALCERLETQAADRMTENVTALHTIFTPGQPITKPSLFSGRRELLDIIQDSLLTKGLNLVVYGQLGLGKTSLVLVALHGSKFVHHVCSRNETFQSICFDILKSLNKQFSIIERSSQQGDAFEVGYEKVAKLTSSNETSAKESAVVPQTLDPNFVAGQLGGLAGTLKAIIIDEFQNVRDPKEQRAVLETAKILSDHGVDIPLIIVGHAPSDTSLFDTAIYHQYKGRYLRPLEVGEMSETELQEIISSRQSNYTPQAIRAIVSIAAGYPTYVHRLALASSLAWIKENKYANIKPGWRSVVPGWFGYDLKQSYPVDGEQFVSLNHVYLAAYLVVKDEKARYCDAFAELTTRISGVTSGVPESDYHSAYLIVEDEKAKYLDQFMKKMSGATSGLPVPEKETGLPVQVLRGSGCIAKLHLEKSRKPVPSLLFPEEKVENETEVLRRWADKFFPYELGLAAEAGYLGLDVAYAPRFGNIFGKHINHKTYSVTIPSGPSALRPKTPSHLTPANDVFDELPTDPSKIRPPSRSKDDPK